MKAIRQAAFLLAVLLLAISASAQDHLSDTEIAAAIAATPGTGFVNIEDMGFATPSLCPAQMASEAIYTPEGWLNALSILSKRQFLPFQPTPEDTLRALTIISTPCVGNFGGPVESITRVALLSDKAGTVVVEAVYQHPLSSTWQNAFGASYVSSSLASRFLLSDVRKVQTAKGEFLIATFNGPRLLKIYTIKEKHLRKLGLISR